MIKTFKRVVLFFAGLALSFSARVVLMLQEHPAAVIRAGQVLFGLGMGIVAYALWHRWPLAAIIVLAFAAGVIDRTIIQNRKRNHADRSR